MNGVASGFLCFALLGALPVLSAHAGEHHCGAASGAQTAALLELYTSEGCSSCPPADRWLRALAESGRYDGKLVPLALHVDYWDDIGWKDAFAQAAFGARQHELARRSGHRVVYTPQVFVEGRPYEAPLSAKTFAAEIDAILRQPPRADLALAAGPVANGNLEAKVSARLRPSAGEAATGLVVVLYQNALATQVTAGENAGALLQHDFVARTWRGPMPLPANGVIEETLTFPVPPGAAAGHLGLAAFVQNLRTLEVLQALSLQVCS